MKPIVIETTSPNTVCVQIVEPEVNGLKIQPEICILVENEDGDHLITLTPGQAENLSNQINALTKHIEQCHFPNE